MAEREESPSEGELEVRRRILKEMIGRYGKGAKLKDVGEELEEDLAKLQHWEELRRLKEQEHHLKRDSARINFFKKNMERIFSWENY